MPDYHDNEWPLLWCRAKEAWEFPAPYHGQGGKKQGEGIYIAHPDTGWTLHPELIKGDRYITDPRIARNFFDQGEFPPAEDPLDGANKSHGTTTASLMLSEEGHPSANDNTLFSGYNVGPELFVTGIAPKVKVIPLRVTDSVMLAQLLTGRTDTYRTLTRAIFHALELDLNVGVISMSLGGKRSPDFLTEALIACRRRGVIPIAAAGQIPGYRGPMLKKPTFPGSSPHTICVAGCDQHYNRPPEGFYGNEVDVTAPGWGVIVARSEAVEATDQNPNPASNFIIDTIGKGTSYATALTAGACALWQAHHSRAYLNERYGPFLLDVFRYLLNASAFKPPPEDQWDILNRGMGVLNIPALLTEPLPPKRIIEDTIKDEEWYPIIKEGS